MRKYVGVSVLILALCLAFASCGGSKAKTYSGELFAMDTYITYSVVTADEAQAEAALEAVEEAFTRVDALTGRFTAGSDVSRINENAGVGPAEVGADTLTIVELALEWAARTDGAFNILLGGVSDLWGFNSEDPAVPAEEALAEALLHTDQSKIVVDAGASTVFLPEAGMVLDLGGVAKGYATDLAAAALRELGVENALINAGGNVYVMGTKEDGSPWRVGVQDPRDSQALTAVIEAEGKALVSSGDYQRYFEMDGVRYHHIIDPATGQPAPLCSGTTVVADSAAVADILSTALFVKGPEAGVALAESLPEADGALLIDRDGRITLSTGMDQFLSEKQ